jgi:hypothetical protein
MMDREEHDLQELCQRVYKEQDPDQLAVLVAELHNALDARADRLRSSTQMTLLHGRAPVDSTAYVSSMALAHAHSLGMPEAPAAKANLQPVKGQEHKVERLIGQASTIICVLLHCFLPLRLIFRRAKGAGAAEPVNAIGSIATGKQLSASTRS